MPLDYSKWDHIQDSDDDDDPAPTSSARAAPVSPPPKPPAAAAPPQEVDLATRLNMGLSGGAGWAALSLKDCSTVTTLRDKLAAFTKMTMTEAAAEVDESMSEVLWELAKKLRVHASECDEALRIGLVEFLITSFIGPDVANRMMPNVGFDPADDEGTMSDKMSTEMHLLMIGYEGTLSILFELCRYRQGCRAVAQQITDGSLLTILVNLARGLAGGYPRDEPEIEDLKAEQRGFCTTRTQIEQALIDTLGRALAGLDQDTSLRKKYAEALLQSELGVGRLSYVWSVQDQTGATLPEPNKLLTRLEHVARTKWTNLASSAQQLATRLQEAAAGRAETVGKPWKPWYVMERGLEANANKGIEELIKGFSKKAKEDPEGFMEVLKNQDMCKMPEGFEGIPPIEWDEKMTNLLMETVIKGEEELDRGCSLQACNACGTQSSDGSMKRCAQCRNAIYCSGACQKKDWSSHKASCIPLRRSKNRSEAGSSQCGGH